MSAEAAYASLPVFAQNLACSWAGYRRSRARFTPHFHRTLASWEESLHAPGDRLHEIQWARLKRLLEHARINVPFYSALPMPVETHDPAESIRETLQAIQPLAKSTYRERTEAFIARNIPKRRLITGKTSGTTGTALKLWFTPEALAEEFACFWRGRRSVGAQIDDPNLTFNGQAIVPIEQDHPPYWRTNYWNHQTLFSIYHCSSDALRHYVNAIHATQAAFAQGYPSFMHLVARAMLDMDRPLPRGHLKACFTSSESLLAFQRKTIEQAFGAPIHDRYGVSEFCVSMTECRARRLHVDMEYCIVEVQAEEETDDWVRGPLLVTGLSNDAAPMIRYQIGDVGTRSKHPCECGRDGDVFLEVDGRIEDYVATPEGRFVGRMDHIFKSQLDVAEAQILQDTTHALEVLIVRHKSYDETSERNLIKEFRSRLGEAIEIHLHYVDSIPRESNGKFRAVKSAVGRLNP
jgi:phenylacetate-coenzyme A ligase PaaK-like adenylate-forming protein